MCNKRADKPMNTGQKYINDKEHCKFKNKAYCFIFTDSGCKFNWFFVNLALANG